MLRLPGRTISCARDLCLCARDLWISHRLTLCRAHASQVGAMAVVDSGWARPDQPVVPATPPQSHVVNARTNPQWNFSANGRRVQGHLTWLSTECFRLTSSAQESNAKLTMLGQLDGAARLLKLERCA